jgi:hypothetical protein
MNEFKSDLVKVTPLELLNNLQSLGLEKRIGRIDFNFAGIAVGVDATTIPDIINISFRAWLNQHFKNNAFYFAEPLPSAEYPHFFLDDTLPFENMLEIKTYEYNAYPTFNIANFESYCSSIKDNPHRLDTQYLVIGYTLELGGEIRIKEMWLRKIWELAGESVRYPLKTQVKRDMIYNIRPTDNFKTGKDYVFESKEDFLNAIYETLVLYKNEDFAKNWLSVLDKNYLTYYGTALTF